MGRNLTLLDFWFYITTFSRYPMEIYTARWGTPLRWSFMLILPVLIVMNVPARLGGACRAAADAGGRVLPPVHRAGHVGLPGLFALGLPYGSFGQLPSASS